MVAEDRDEVGSGSMGLGGEDVGEEPVLAREEGGRACEVGEAVPSGDRALCGG